MNLNHNFDSNIDKDVVNSFGEEWKKFAYTDSDLKFDLDSQFEAYSKPVNLDAFDPRSSIAADFGAGSGRWTIRLTPYFSQIYALDPSSGSTEVLMSKFAKSSKITVLNESIGKNSIPDCSLDLAMSLGVLHHLPDTAKGLTCVAQKIKPGGVLWCYMYYRLENKSRLYRGLFRASGIVRLFVSHLPFFWRRVLADVIAALIYLPFARFSHIMGKRGIDVSNYPLHHYSNMPFVMMRNDALDRFGTQIEQRFSKKDICEMLIRAGFDLSTLNFSDAEPFWTFSVKKL